MSLYCTNIDVYFDNKAVYNSKCVEGHDMHNDNDNLWHQEFGKFVLRGCWDFQNNISHPALTGCTLHFFFFPVNRWSFEVICIICQ